MANKYIVVLLFVIAASCESDRKKVEKYVAVEMATIKANLDSAAYLYDGALHDLFFTH